MEAIYRFFYESLSLKSMGILLGLGLVAGHAAAYLKAEPLKTWLVRFPRNKQAGIVLLIACTVWSLILISFMDLGEFYTVRKFAQLILPVGAALVIFYVDEFLAVRAMGVLLMLMAGPVLNSAFLEPPFTRLLLPLLAYVWIIVGMFWVGMPYLMRDWIDWVIKKDTGRWKYACYIGLGYGALTLLCAMFFY